MGVGDLGVFTLKPPGGLGAGCGSRAGLASRRGSGAAPGEAVLERIACLPASYFSPTRLCRDGEGDKAWVQPYIRATLGAGTGLMATLMVEVGREDVEAQIPAGTTPNDNGVQDLGSGSNPLLSGDGADLRPGPEQPPEPSGVVMHSDLTDLGQGDRPRMSFPDANQTPAILPLVAQAETVSTAAFALVPWEADLAAVCAFLGALVGTKRTTEIDCSLLEHLCRHLMPPGKSGHPPGGGAIDVDDEHPAGVLAPLPGVEGVDEVVSGPRHLDRRVNPLRAQRLGDEPERRMPHLE